MYNNMRTSASTSAFSDSKYTVADILSSMANGEPVTPTFSGAHVSGIVSATTPTSLLTPTTLASLEQTFMELQSAAPAVSLARGVSQSGFVPPVVDPVRSNAYEYSSSDSEWSLTDSPAAKRSRPSGGTKATAADVARPGRGGRRSKYEKLSPEEEERRRIRRERNKVAAAKCRQRRVDITNTLVNETEKLEDEKASLENEIQSLQQQKEQLEFLLQAHKPLCNLHKSKQGMKSVIVKQEPGVDSAVTRHRPNSLPLSQTSSTSASGSKVSVISEVLGIPITTPSSGVYTLTLDSIVDHTGLTPITGPSCASQVQRSSSDSSSDNLVSPSKLMAL